MSHSQNKPLTLEDRLQRVSRPQEKFRKLSDLTEGIAYSPKFALIESAFGLKLAVYINGDLYFLPARYSKEFGTQKDVDLLNEQRMNLFYNGVYRGSHVIRLERNLSLDCCDC